MGKPWARNPDLPGLTEEEALLLTRQVADLAASGLPLPEGLRALASELNDGRVSVMARDLADRMERGQSLPDALNDLEGRIPVFLREVLIAGVRSGHIGALLGEFVDHTRVARDLKRGLFLALLYPALLVVAFSLFFLLVYALLVPQFVAIFRDFNLPLPALTQLLIRTSDTLRLALPEVTLWTIAPLVVLGLAWRLLLDDRSRRWVVCHVPLIGPIWHWSALARFCHYLGLMIDAELPLESAVPLAADATADAELVASSRWVARELQGGRSLAAAIARVPVFPDGVSRLLSWAEGGHKLSSSLHLVAEMLMARARGRASFVAAVVAVFVVVMVLWAVSLTVVGLFLPLIQLISKLSG